MHLLLFSDLHGIFFNRYDCVQGVEAKLGDVPSSLLHGKQEREVSSSNDAVVRALAEKQEEIQEQVNLALCH